MPENVALPDPAKVVRASFPRVLEVVYRRRCGGNGTCQELLKTRYRVDPTEAHHAGVEHDMRHVREPIINKTLCLFWWG